MAVGELNTLSGKSGLAGTVGVASVKKSCHSEFLEEIQVPVPWPGLTAPCMGRVNVGSCCYNSVIAHPSAALSFMPLHNENWELLALLGKAVSNAPFQKTSFTMEGV